MGGRLRFRSLVTSVLACSSIARAALAQTAPPPPAAAPTAPKVAPAPAAAPTAPKAAPAPAPAPAPVPVAAPVPAPAPPPPATAAFPVAPASAPAAPPPPAAAPAPPIRRARVSFDADQPGAVLETDHTPEGKVPWYVVCENPCSRIVNAEGMFRVSGPGYHPSRPFMLSEEKSEHKVTAEMESSSLAAPMALTVVGGGIATAGLLSILGGVSQEQQHRDGQQLILVGSIVGGVGSVIAGIGVIMLLVKTQHTESRAHVARQFEPKLGARGMVF